MRVVSILLLLVTLAACDSSEDVVEANSLVTVAYEGRLTDGTVFDSSERAQFSMQGVISGFRDGMLGMRVGEMRTFSVAPEDGYGNRQVGPIPPNSTLIFDVTVFEIR